MVLATSGRRVMIRAVPLAGAIAIVATIIFAGHGLRARDVTALMHGSLAVRASMWIVWTALASPVIAEAFDAPGTRMLRSIVRSSRALIAMLVALAALAQVPWIVLFVRGDGALAAIDAALLAVAACASTSMLGRSRRALPIFAGTCALVAIDRAPFTVLPAALLAWIATRNAWCFAFEERGAVRIVRISPAAIALASAYVARMIRSARGRLQSAALIVFAGGAALALTLRNDPDARPVQRALVVFAFPISIACGILAAPAIETEARLRPILRATRTRAYTMALAMMLALAAPSTAFAGTASVLAAVASHAPQTITFASMGWSVVLASSIALWARRSSRARRESTFLVGVIVIASAFTAVAASC